MVGAHTAACVAVGSELLGDRRLDRNSLRISAELARFGFQVVEKRVVGDDVARLAATLGELLGRVEVVVVTGGLGPTADDVTREAVALATGRTLVRDPQLEAAVRERYRAAGRVMPEICVKMAEVVTGSQPLANTCGAAPGIFLEGDGTVLVALPGVPSEMEAMLVRDVVPILAARGDATVRRARTLLLGGVVESETETRVSHLYDRFGRDDVTILASYGVVRLVVSASGEAAAVELRLDEMEGAFRAVLGDDVAGTDVAGLAEVVLARLGQRGETLAVAESCTGGLVASWLTEVAGASTVFMGGVVSYSNAAKEAVLGVPQQVLVEHGAVSEAVARAMAEGARACFATTWGVGVTGIAGPTGGTVDKPVGLVHWAVAGPAATVAGRRLFPGNRALVREWSANAVLDHLRRAAR